MGGGCSSNPVFVKVEQEVFDMLRQMVSVDADLAVKYIDGWLNKNVSQSDAHQMIALKSAAIVKSTNA